MADRTAAILESEEPWMVLVRRLSEDEIASAVEVACAWALQAMLAIALAVEEAHAAALECASDAAAADADARATEFDSLVADASACDDQGWCKQWCFP